ncbi:MAG: SDR family oxidoreductase [Caldilineae bacterium]|nr:MAG: SDR family oxidoreductase [Caldilineae bacterium]
MKKWIVGAASALAIAGLLKWKRNRTATEGLEGQLPAGRRRVLIAGATSAIAQETAKRFAAAGDALFLAGRNRERLEAIAADLRVRGAERVGIAVLDLTETEQHPALIEEAADALGGLDTVLIAHGTLSDQSACQQDFALTEREMKTNFLSVVSLLTHLANRFEAQGYGTIAVISSVAGDRGRQSNYVYGAAKAGVSAFLQGLRNRLHRAGVTVITIKPGFVDTPMTAHIPDKGLLWVGPDVVGRGIYRAIQRRQDVVYLPWFWWGIMWVIKHIPEGIFKKMSL